jgi:hypothetical protein
MTRVSTEAGAEDVELPTLSAPVFVFANKEAGETDRIAVHNARRDGDVDEKRECNRVRDHVFREFIQCWAHPGAMHPMPPEPYLHLRAELSAVHRGLQKHWNDRQECVPA